ncbi:MAG: hypothetical protein HKO99_14685 [Xanthomonadales bacterium]|nr:hypothetical protein [Gammaproteobacteria bacterium]NNK52839.1 hypothetical protein [Xanthomonadales bacterium]
MSRSLRCCPWGCWAPEVMGRLSASLSIAALIAFAPVWLGMEYFGVGYRALYLVAGGVALLIAVAAVFVFPVFPQAVPQRKHLLTRRRYWLYYALTFMSGARRQIFVVFAGFLMVEKFGFSAANIALLFLFNHGVNVWLARMVPRNPAEGNEVRPPLGSARYRFT